MLCNPSNCLGIGASNKKINMLIQWHLNTASTSHIPPSHSGGFSCVNFHPWKSMRLNVPCLDLPDSAPVVSGIHSVLKLLDEHSLRAVKNLVREGAAKDSKFCEQVGFHIDGLRWWTLGKLEDQCWRVWGSHAVYCVDGTLGKCFSRRYHYPKDPSKIDPWIYVEHVYHTLPGFDISWRWQL